MVLLALRTVALAGGAQGVPLRVLVVVALGVEDPHQVVVEAVARVEALAQAPAAAVLVAAPLPRQQHRRVDLPPGRQHQALVLGDILTQRPREEPAHPHLVLEELADGPVRRPRPRADQEGTAVGGDVDQVGIAVERRQGLAVGRRQGRHGTNVEPHRVARRVRLGLADHRKLRTGRPFQVGREVADGLNALGLQAVRLDNHRGTPAFEDRQGTRLGHDGDQKHCQYRRATHGRALSSFSNATPAGTGREPCRQPWQPPLTIPRRTTEIHAGGHGDRAVRRSRQRSPWPPRKGARSFRRRRRTQPPTAAGWGLLSSKSLSLSGSESTSAFPRLR